MTNSNASSLTIISDTTDAIRGHVIVIQKTLTERETLEEHKATGHKLTVAEGLPIIMGVYKIPADAKIDFDAHTGTWTCSRLAKWQAETAAAASLASKNKEKFVPPEPPCLYCGRLLKPETDEVTICAASPNSMDELTALALLTRKEAMQ